MICTNLNCKNYSDCPKLFYNSNFDSKLTIIHVQYKPIFFSAQLQQFQFLYKIQIKTVLNIIFIDIVLQGAYYNILTVALRVYLRKTNITLMEYIIVTSLIITIFLNSLSN